MVPAHKHFLTAAVYLCLSVVSPAQQVPATRAEALDKSVVTFPQSNSAKPLLLLIGFSHKSQKQCNLWNARLKPAYLIDTQVAYYELADFQGVPSLVMAMILHGMRREIPRDEHAHFVLLQSDEAKWKALVNYSAPDDAYLIVADPSGRVLWQTNGALTDQKYSELHTALHTQALQP